MTDLRDTLQAWTRAGYDNWLRSFQLVCIEHLALVDRLGRKLDPAVLDYLAALQKLIKLGSRYWDFYASPLKRNDFTLKKLQAMQKDFYADLDPQSGYAESFANPAYAVQRLGKELGQQLCMVYARFRDYPAMLIQQRFVTLGQLNRLFADLTELGYVYGRDASRSDALHKVIRRFMEQDMFQRQLFSLYWRYSPRQDYFKNIILKADLSDLTYLYRYGVHISKHVLELARFMNSYPETELKQLSRYIVQAYKDGFIRGNRSHKIKKYASLIIPAGMERLGRFLVRDLGRLGLESVVQLPRTQGFNKQYDYDHRFSQAVFFDQKFVDKMLKAHERALRQMADLLRLQAGPVYVEQFGEQPFCPQDNPAAFKLSPEQRQLLQQFSGLTAQNFYRYYKREESSFCIIAFPSPEIGNDFRRIFADTLEVNLLDSMHYARLQQKIIDVLDRAEYVRVKGKAGNQTDISVRLHKLQNPQTQTNFENCVADVNIPVGEVFTSPLLKGTNGTLHVRDIYLHNLRFKNLKLTFKDGMIRDYSCSNFKDRAANRKYVEENLLLPHKTLPIGEFAIGTNTAAYRMALRYGILHLLPILIIEKMGPHFAVGDTCYSHEEDVDHFNFFDGKKIIAVENEFSALRKKDPLKAYTQVHTDITLPYEMLGSIAAIGRDGSRTYIIKDGLFAVPGTEELNQPLLKIRKK